MALLSEAERKEYFNYLDLGEYNKDNILKLQKKYLLRKSDWDGIYGTNTDNILRHLKAVKDNCTTFAPEEFRCGCNGRYCCGYPTWMKPMELANIQKIRDHYGKPMTVTCGVRCNAYNKAVGGISNSEHKVGLAVDYYIKGVTDTLANRKSSIKWISTLPNHHYTYGNGIYAETVNGRTKTGSVSASGMGNCMHTDCYDGTPTPAGKIAEDGIAGASTVRRMQKVFGTAEDGVISGQRKDLISKYFPSLISVDYNKVKSTLVARIQRWAGVTADGVWGKGTSTAVQNKLNGEGYNCGKADGVFGAGSTMAFQRWLNDHDTPTPDTPTPQPTPTPTPSKNEIISTAESLAWGSGTASSKYAYKGGSPTSAFKKAFDKVYPTHNKWGAGPKTGASCDVAVGTVMRYSGVDPKYPRGCDEQKKYTSSKLQKFVYKNVKPIDVVKAGDAVLYTKNSSGSSNHTLIVGDGCLYEAQYKKTYFHKVSSLKKLNTKRPKVYVFRKK